MLNSSHRRRRRLLRGADDHKARLTFVLRVRSDCNPRHYRGNRTVAGAELDWNQALVAKVDAATATRWRPLRVREPEQSRIPLTIRELSAEA
jgi:hypothetical protein